MAFVVVVVVVAECQTSTRILISSLAMMMAKKPQFNRRPDSDSPYKTQKALPPFPSQEFQFSSVRAVVIRWIFGSSGFVWVIGCQVGRATFPDRERERETAEGGFMVMPPPPPTE